MLRPRATLLAISMLASLAIPAPAQDRVELAPTLSSDEHWFATGAKPTRRIDIAWTTQSRGVQPAHFYVEAFRTYRLADDARFSLRNRYDENVVVLCRRYTSDAYNQRTFRRAVELARWLSELRWISREFDLAYHPDPSQDWLIRWLDWNAFMIRTKVPAHAPIVSVSFDRWDENPWGRMVVIARKVEVRPDEARDLEEYHSDSYSAIFQPIDGRPSFEYSTSVRPDHRGDVYIVQDLASEVEPGAYLLHVVPRNDHGSLDYVDFRRVVLVEIPNPDSGGRIDYRRTFSAPQFGDMIYARPPLIGYDSVLDIAYEAVIAQRSSEISFPTRTDEVPYLMWKAHPTSRVRRYHNRFYSQPHPNDPQGWGMFQGVGSYYRFAANQNPGTAVGSSMLTWVQAQGDSAYGKWVGFEITRMPDRSVRITSVMTRSTQP